MFFELFDCLHVIVWHIWLRDDCLSPITLFQLEKGQMAPSKTVKVRLHIIIHVIAITCIVWFTYILTNRSHDTIDTWFNCERLAIFFVVLGEIILISLHCEMYQQLFRRWRSSITVIKVQNMPDKDKMMQQQQREPVSDISHLWNSATLAISFLTDSSGMPRKLMCI